MEMSDFITEFLAVLDVGRSLAHVRSEYGRETCSRLFKRYVDDIFAIVEVGKEELLLEHLNCLFPNCISFTIEKETRGRLPFLDALVIRSKNRLKTTVYRKPTHSDRYLHFSSHHPRSVFTGIIRGMVDRALSMCDAEFLEGELRFNQHVDALNRYNRAVIKLNGLQQTRPDSSISQREEGTSTTRHKGRGRPPKKKKQTTKSQRKPAKTMADATKSSAVVQHFSECSLDLIPTIICRENQFSLRKVKEAFYIRHNDTFNRDSGAKLAKRGLT
ncbi:hypothetical protein M513_08481 [Trichuris suis]|uniref:Helix-turn-helix domain-containing protein n=1 Tax=Trichuris suis TaxID=68888 RepID=A0A085M0C8_9BILA|nr:hypothetical protein M513_08481 [Trichuris suis]